MIIQFDCMLLWWPYNIYYPPKLIKCEAINGMQYDK